MGKIDFDLRMRKQNFKSHYSLEDIVYSTYQTKYTHNVQKMIIIEKQPQYVFYPNNYFNAGTSMITGAFSAAGYKSGKAFKQIMIGAAKQAGAGTLNTIIDARSSGDNNPDGYHVDMTYGRGLRTLFDADVIATYEVPYFSNYFLDVDGTQGWETNGLESVIGDVAKIVEHAHIGYPVAPIWKYDSKRPSTTCEFNLLNNDTASLIKNLNFLMALTPGMLHVLTQLNNNNRDEILDGIKTSFGQQTATGEADGKPSIDLSINQVGNFLVDTVGGVVYDLAKFADMLTTSFKSPNVYEIVVPGRFRWLWCTMSMVVENVGKLYNDKVNISGHPVFGSDAELIGFPETYKVKLAINSLLPQSYNEFCYFTQDGDFERSVTDDYNKYEREQALRQDAANYIANGGGIPDNMA